jgi:Protein of unknown function (DUF3592)
MGLLSWLNRRGLDVVSPDIVDPGFKRADRALEKGAAASATLVGIEQKLDDSTTTRFVAVAIPTANGTHTAGVHVMHGPAHVLARLRLGMEVLVRHDDGDAVVLDWPAMCARWGVTDQPAAQKRRRKPPAEGVTDNAVDGGEKRKLKKWTPRRATIVSLSRRDSAFGPTLNFDVALRLDDGAHAVAGKTEVPFYAGWLAAPGAEIPVAVDPKDPAKAVVDWAAAANESGRSPGRLDDPPPDGGAAALLVP